MPFSAKGGTCLPYLRRAWTVVSVLACVLVIFFGVRAYQQHKYSEEIAVQTYNEWRNQMVGIQDYLHSIGPGEKPHPHGSWSQNSNMALINAESISQTARAVAGEAAMILHGQTSSVFSQMAIVSVSLQTELDDMIDHGRYVHGVYEFTEPVHVSIADRDFLYRQLVDIVLAGMPMTVTNVRQINAQSEHLSALTNANSKTFGVFSDAFIKFMRSTGQFQ